MTQDDVLFPQLTVEETLVFAAFLRLPARMSKQQKRDRVDAIITELNLERLLNHRYICLPDWHGIYYIFFSCSMHVDRMSCDHRSCGLGAGTPRSAERS